MKWIAKFELNTRAVARDRIEIGTKWSEYSQSSETERNAKRMAQD